MTDRPPSAPPPFLTSLLKAVTPFAAAGTVIAAALTFSSFAARYHWRLEQACHFRVQYFWSLLLAAVVLKAAQRPRIAILAFLAATTNLSAIAPIYWPTKSTDNS